MDLVAVAVFVLLVIMAIFGLVAMVLDYRENKVKHRPVCVVYLLRFSEDGKAEIKMAPKQDIWNWRF